MSNNLLAYIGGGTEKRKLRAVFATNTIIHYTINLSEAFINNPDIEDFRLIITQSLPQELIELGLNENFNKNYIIDARENKKAAIDAINNADLMIGTYYINDLMKERVAAGKITFIASERIFKPYNSFFLLNSLKNLARWIKFKAILTRFHYFNENIYFLLIGKHAPSDYINLGVSKNKILKFGYFPALNELLRKNYCAQEKNEKIHLLWAGRLVSWKHPEYAVKTCKYLTQKGYKIDLKIIGNGPEEANLKKEAKGCENIYFLGGLPVDKVRKLMSESDIFLFTSNQAEGWGVVLSEAMSEGMCVIASESAGATNELIQDCKNGKIYSLDSLTELKSITEQILIHSEEIPRLGKAAQKFVNEKWNAKIFVSDFINFCREKINFKS